jgi:hypothetical protein
VRRSVRRSRDRTVGPAFADQQVAEIKRICAGSARLLRVSSLCLSQFMIKALPTCRVPASEDGRLSRHRSD